MEEEDPLLTNTEKIIKQCENHTLEILDQNETLFADIKDLLEKIEEKIKFSKGDKKIMDNLFFIIKFFIDNYSQY